MTFKIIYDLVKYDFRLDTTHSPTVGVGMIPQLCHGAALDFHV